MNELRGIIKSISTEAHISLVVVEAAGINWHSLVIDTPGTANYLQEGKEVVLVFKESAVSIAKGATGLFSVRNRISCVIIAIETGSVLSKVTLGFEGQTLTSVITTNAVTQLHLQAGDDVEAFIKTTDISLLQT